MEISIVVIVSLTFIGVILNSLMSWRTESKKQKTKDAEQVKLREHFSSELGKLLNQLESKVTLASEQVMLKMDAKFQETSFILEQSNENINSGFVQIHSENEELRKDVAGKISEFKASHKEYTDKVKDLLNKYSADNTEFKKSAEQNKEQIKKELQNILKEIKAPLDLD